MSIQKKRLTRETKLATGLWVSMVFIQLIIACGLILVGESDRFGLAHQANGSAQTLQLLEQMEQKYNDTAEAVIRIEYIRPVLIATKEVFRHLAKLVSSAGYVILISIVFQLIALVTIWRNYNRLESSEFQIKPK